MTGARLLLATATAGLALMAGAPAQAVCAYRGELYARTTLAQEFANARRVVRVRLLSADTQAPDNGTDEPSTLYRVSVIDAFKGEGGDLSVFTLRNSGGFYLDRGPQPDIGGEYLLFLDPAPDGLPARARGAQVVHYSCGQSRRWSEVSAQARRELEALRPQA